MRKWQQWDPHEIPSFNTLQELQELLLLSESNQCREKNQFVPEGSMVLPELFLDIIFDSPGHIDF
jgi:hypothetical protein